MVNLDPKLDIKELGRALQIAKDMEVEDQIMLKGTADTAEQLANIEDTLAKLNFQPQFMPLHWDKNIDNIAPVERSFAALKPEASEMVVNLSCDPERRVVEDGGLLFSLQVRELARKNSVHLWINTLYIDPLRHSERQRGNVMWNGGRHDILGLKYPDQVYKFWADQGATIIQTDEPKFLIEYLERKGLREKRVAGKNVTVKGIK